ncbi:MAG: flippase [Methanomassiliicoccales archaeon]|nr:flippase [Methanomassiliicoccales archaeon]
MLGRRSFVLFLSRMLSSALAFVGLYYVTRYLGTDIYGTVAWTMSFVATFNAVADLGFSSAHVKRISEGQDPDDCISTFAIIKLILTGAMVVLILCAVFVYTSVLGETLEDTSTDLILLFILYQVLYNLSSIATITFQAKMEMAKMPLVTMIDPLVRVPLVIFVSLNRMGIMELAFTYVIAAIAVSLSALFLLFRDKIKWKRPTLLRSYYKFALPLLVITIISAVSGNMDRLLIGFFWTSSDVGLYSAPLVFLGVFATISTAVSTLTFPSFSKLHSEGNLAEIRSLSKQAERYIMMIGLPLTILIIMFPTEICLVLLGPLFKDSGKVIGIMAITNLLTMINVVHGSQIIAVGRPDLSARISIFTVALSIGLLFLLIPSGLGLGMSYVGAALALMVGNVVGFVIVRYVVWKLTGTTPNARLSLQLLAGAVVVTALYVLDMFVSIGGWFTLSVFALGAFVVFLAVLAALKEFTKADLDYFLELVNVKKMFSYIKGELKGK